MDFQEYFKEKITEVRPLSHNGNNQLFEIKFPGKSYLLKQYCERGKEDWNRGKKEFSALSYLWDKGFRNIPRPHSINGANNVAVYSYEAGATIDAAGVKREHIHSAVDFLENLHGLPNEDKVMFEPASSACISLRDYLEVLDRRFVDVSQFTPDSSLTREAGRFLEGEVFPEIQRLKKESLTERDLTLSLPLDSQVLTPADFGFHNMLFSPKGYKVVDFEYFGRDDPARQVMDFLHHDQSIGLSQELKDLFLEDYREKARPRAGFEERLRFADPLVGMSWVLIYLNVLPRAQSSSEEILEKRLEKAKNKIGNLRYLKI